MSYRRGYYKKDGTYVQGHFVNKARKSKKVEGSNKNGCLGIFIGLFILTIGLCYSAESTCETKKHSNFVSKPETQEIYNSNNDNIVCKN